MLKSFWRPLRSNFNTREFNGRELFCLLNLLETVFPVLDHRWTQDNPIFNLTFDHKMGTYTDQGSSTVRAWVFHFSWNMFTTINLWAYIVPLSVCLFVCLFVLFSGWVAGGGRRAMGGGPRQVCTPQDPLESWSPPRSARHSGEPWTLRPVGRLLFIVFIILYIAFYSLFSTGFYKAV